VQYQLLKLIFRFFGTSSFYDVNVPNKRVVDYSNLDDIKRGNETSVVYKDHSRVFLGWFQGRIQEHDFARKRVLDLGSGFGGRTIHYAQAGGPALCVGIDIDEVGVSEGSKFARYLGQTNLQFVLGRGEQLPFKENAFDYVLSYDVLEHVNDFEHVFQEVYRVLRKGGRFLSVFPPYYGPMGHHIKRTKLPWINVFFSTEKTYEVLRKEYGDSFELWPHRGKILRRGLNGTTVKAYRRYLGRSQYKIVHEKLAPLLSKPTEIYRGIRSQTLKELLRILFAPTPKIPMLREFLTHRIVFVLEK